MKLAAHPITFGIDQRTLFDARRDLLAKRLDQQLRPRWKRTRQVGQRDVALDCVTKPGAGDATDDVAVAVDRFAAVEDAGVPVGGQQPHPLLRIFRLLLCQDVATDKRPLVELHTEAESAKGQGDALEGTWISSRSGESKVLNVKFAKGKLTFIRKVSFNEQEMEMSFVGKVAGDKLTGEVSSEFGEIDVVGTREAVVAARKPKKAAVPAVSPLVGTWEVTTSSQRGERKSKLIINADLSGTTESDRGKRPIKNLKLDGKKVTYQMVITRQDRDFTLDFSGTLDGTKMTGKYSVEERGAVADITAVKIVAKPEKPAAKPEAALVGTWDLISESDRGERKAQLIVKNDLTASYETERGPMKVSNLSVKDGKLTFTITIVFGDNEIALDFKGKLSGDSLAGVFAVEDRGDVADVSGKKRK